MAAEQSSANLAIEETINRARRLFSSGTGTTLAILKEADQRLSEKLHKLATKAGGPTATFTGAHATVAREQIKVTTDYLEKRLAGHTHEQATQAIDVSVKATVKLAKKLEKRFTGLTRPLALDSQQIQDEVVRGTGSSLLRKQQSSFLRYGQAMVGDFERVLRVAQLEGLDFHQTVSRLVDSGKLGRIGARSLHAKEPGYFPEPTSYVKRRYWAERIVRTEMAYAYNAASLQTMNVARETDFPDMQKKILATFDSRTAADSIAVHGQVRKLEDMFVDGAGRHYLHPPGRPNDRETVVPWRPHWEELPATEPAPPAAQAEAKLAATPPPVTQTAGQRKLELKNALAKAKASVLAKKTAKAEAQGLELAKAKAKMAQAAGQQNLAEALAKQQAATAAVSKTSAVVAPAQKIAQMKATAAAYKAQVEALSKAKVEAEIAAKAAKLRSEAQATIQTVKDLKFVTHKDLMFELKGVYLSGPQVFEELAKQVLGKPIGKTPLPLAIAKVGKKLYPDLDWPKPKPKAAKAAEKLEKTAAKLLKTKNVGKELAALSGEELSALIKAKLPIIKGGADVWANIYKSTPALHADLQALLKAQAQAELSATTWELKEEAVSGVTYVNVFDAKGNKLAYFFKEGDSYVVKPPAELNDPTAKMLMQEAKLTDPKQAAAYASQVSKAIQMKGAAPKVAATAPLVVQPAKPKLAPGEMAWSGRYQAPTREKAKLSDPVKDLREGLGKDTRHGHALALDKDKIENFDVSFTTEIVDGRRDTVVRFKVTEHASKAVLEKLRALPGAKNVEYQYRRLASLNSQVLEKAEKAGGMPGTWTAGAQVKGAVAGKVDVTMSRSHAQGGSEIAAGHNLVEIRFPEPKDQGKSYTETAHVMKQLGIDPERPTEAELKVYKRAKIMAYVDSDAARELAKVPERVPAAVDGVWSRAVKRNPRLEEIERDAELREVSPGHMALYSPTVGKMLEESGVRWLEHNLAGDAEVLEQMFIHDPNGGLLSSRERFQRGLTFQGMSTTRDFQTGGADSVFMRLKTTAGSAAHYGTTVEIDPRELGRLDAYFFNSDNYGAAGAVSERQTIDKIQHTVRSGKLSSSNEIMMQKQVPPTSIRRVRTVHRAAMLKKAKAAGLTEINGVPVEDFFAE